VTFVALEHSGLLRSIQRLFNRNPSSRNTIREGLTIDEFEHQKLRLIVCRQVVNSGDVLPH
jgi:hypothetical protein